MRFLRLAIFSLGAALAGCGGTATPTTTDKPPLYVCQTFTPCHDGNVVGTWRLSHVCLDQDYLQVSTPCGADGSASSVTEITAYSATGTLDIGADGTVTFETDERAYEHSHHPAVCSSDPTAAAAYCDAQRNSGASCTLANGDCDCTWINETTWPTPTSTFAPGDTTIFDMDFCVNGAGLTLRKVGGDYVFVPE